MSLILEALRKSEAERRRGQAPDVLADMPAPQPVARHTPPVWLWLLPLVVVLLVALWLLRDRKTPLPEATHPAPAQQAATDPEQPPGQMLPPVQRLTPQPHVTQPQPARPVAKAASPTPVANAPQTALGKQAPLPTAPTTVTPPRATPVTATPLAAPARTFESIATTQPTPTQPDDANTTQIASLSDLTTTQRESLPPLKISMHLWNADPARRFVILDGNRVVEGDRVGDAVVKDITTDGVVIDWRGQRIKLPIR